MQLQSTSDNKQLAYQLESWFSDNNLDLTNSLAVGVLNELSSLFKKSKHVIKNILRDLRHDIYHPLSNIYTTPRIIESSDMNTDIQDYCLDNELYRGAPTKEAEACDAISKKIIDLMIKYGKGVSLLIGTPSPYSASKNKNYPALCSDNLMIANSMNLTSKLLTIVVGDAINKKKAELKGYQWRAINTLRKAIVMLDIVDAINYYKHVEILASTHPNEPIKVVLLNSGVWYYNYNTKLKYQTEYNCYLDLNFEKPSLKLTEKYDNVHILAMCYNGKSYGFDVRYLHKNKNIIL